MVTQTGSTANPFTYQGEFGVMREGSTSMYYMRARYYDSGPARFLSRDPLALTDPRAINPYQFVYANPVEYTDPSGQQNENPSSSPTPPWATSAAEARAEQIGQERWEKAKKRALVDLFFPGVIDAIEDDDRARAAKKEDDDRARAAKNTDSDWLTEYNNAITEVSVTWTPKPDKGPVATTPLAQSVAGDPRQVCAGSGICTAGENDAGISHGLVFTFRAPVTDAERAFALASNQTYPWVLDIVSTEVSTASIGSNCSANTLLSVRH
jgi:RHS repeat-associated protein